MSRRVTYSDYMPHEQARIIAVWLSVACLLCITWTPAAKANEDRPRIDAIPLVQFSSKKPKISNSRTYHRKVSRLTFDYDDEFRSPVHPPAAMANNCETDRLLGVTFFLIRQTQSAAEHVRYVVRFSHFSPASGKEEISVDRKVVFWYDQKTQVLTEALVRDGHASRREKELIGFSKDGIISISILANGRELFRSNFERTGCTATNSGSSRKT